MEPVVIRYNKKILLFMLCMLCLSGAFITWYFFFRGKIVPSRVIYLIYSALLIYIVYTIIFIVRKLRSDDPAITITIQGIEFLDKKEKVFLLWNQVTELEIKKDDNTQYLLIESANQKSKINISLLDRKPEEISRLISEYRGM